MMKRIFVVAAVALVLAHARADIAIVRPQGPRSAAVFANAGRALDAGQTVSIAMRSADVAIVLRKAGGDALRAECRAEFELENLARDGAPVEFMVAFPLTGLAREKALRELTFKVEVDGAQRDVVRRDTVSIGYFRGRQYGPQDESVKGRLTGRFAPPVIVLDPDSGPRDAEGKPVATPLVAGHPPGSGYWNGIRLAEQKGYPTAFLWTQSIAPGKKQRVVVSYALRLEPQSAANAPETLGRAAVELAGLNPKGNYYFFDYVLESGATWEGAIGRETITLTADGIELAGLLSFGRKPERRGKSWVWQITNEKPAEDVLLALPR